MNLISELGINNIDGENTEYRDITLCSTLSSRRNNSTSEIKLSKTCFSMTEYVYNMYTSSSRSLHDDSIVGKAYPNNFVGIDINIAVFIPSYWTSGSHNAYHTTLGAKVEQDIHEDKSNKHKDLIISLFSLIDPFNMCVIKEDPAIDQEDHINDEEGKRWDQFENKNHHSLPGRLCWT